MRVFFVLSFLAASPPPVLRGTAPTCPPRRASWRCTPANALPLAAARLVCFRPRVQNVAQDINNRLAKLEALERRGVQAKDGKSEPSGGGGGSKVLGLSLPLTSEAPWWGRRRDDPAGLRRRDEQGSLQDASGGSARTTASAVSAAEGTGSRSLDLSPGTRSVPKGMEGSGGERVAPGSANINIAARRNSRLR